MSQNLPKLYCSLSTALLMEEPERRATTKIPDPVGSAIRRPAQQILACVEGKFDGQHQLSYIALLPRLQKSLGRTNPSHWLRHQPIKNTVDVGAMMFDRSVAGATSLVQDLSVSRHLLNISSAEKPCFLGTFVTQTQQNNGHNSFPM